MINCSVAARSPSVAGAGCCPAFDVTIVRILTNIRRGVNSLRRGAHFAPSRFPEYNCPGAQGGWDRPNNPVVSNYSVLADLPAKRSPAELCEPLNRGPLDEVVRGIQIGHG